MRATLVFLLLIASCREESFVGDTTEEQTKIETSDRTPKTPKPQITSEPLSSKTHYQLSPQLFTINPSGEQRSETVGFIKKVTITMESLTQQSSETISSPARTLHSKSFTQTGRDGTPRQVDTFDRQRDKGLLDLLLIVDDSESMKKVHGHMVNNLTGLLSEIDNSNWKINIVDVDTNQLCEHTIIDRNNKFLYATTLNALTNSPNSNERAIVKARVALGLDRRCNYRWKREGSTLAAVIITDEDHQCTNRGAADNRGNDSNSFFCENEVGNFISEFRGLRPTTRLYGIFNTVIKCGNKSDCLAIKDLKKCPSARGQFAKKGYPCFARYDNHSASRICLLTNPCYNRGDDDLYGSRNYLAPGRSAYDLIKYYKDDYRDILRSISVNIKEILQNQFTLSYLPDNNGVEVKVDNRPTPAENYRLTDKILEFIIDPGGDAISISYVPTGGEQPVAYLNTLSVRDREADLTTATVRVGNRTLTRDSDYRVSGQTITLAGDMRNVFPSGATATVSYYRHQNKKNIFDFADGKEIVDGSVHVVGASNNYQVNDNRIEFDSGHEPDYGATFSIGYRYYSGNKMNYPINNRWSVGRVECDQDISCEYRNNSIVITSGFRRGGSFTATIHPTSDTQQQSDYTDLPTTETTGYVPETLCLARQLQHCQQGDDGAARPACDGRQCCSEKQLVIDNDKIMLTTANADDNGCAMLGTIATEADIDQLQLHYQTYTPQRQVEVSNTPLIEFLGQYQNERWEVFVNNQKKIKDTDYTIDHSQRTINFNKEQYPVDSKVSVVIHLLE